MRLGCGEVGGAQRSPYLPDTPTMQEAGVSKIVSVRVNETTAKAKTPAAPATAVA